MYPTTVSVALADHCLEQGEHRRKMAIEPGLYHGDDRAHKPQSLSSG